LYLGTKKKEKNANKKTRKIEKAHIRYDIIVIFTLKKKKYKIRRT
jgi:mRNA-degrading endonuclease YafQ of YafQ-DinJ toxin-antitoxin module